MRLKDVPLISSSDCRRIQGTDLEENRCVFESAIGRKEQMR